MRRSTAVLVLLALTIQACAVWVPQHGVPPLDSSRHSVRVHERGAGRFVLRRAHTSATAITGVVGETTRLQSGRVIYQDQLLTIPLDQIESVEIAKVSRTRTALLVVGIAGAFAVLTLVAIADTFDTAFGACGMAC